MDSKERSIIYARIRTDHGAGLARLVRGYVSHREDQEDLLQEIALALWRALPRFRRECSERTFVYRIAHNCCVDKVIRKRSLKRAVVEMNELVSQAPDAETLLVASNRRQRLLHTIQELSLSHRQILLLALEGMSHLEIAEIIGITPNNVGVRLNRARRALREKFVA